MSSRVSNLPSINGVELHIRAQKDWGSLIFLPLWLTFWTFGGLKAMSWVVEPRSSAPNAFIALWLVGWACGEVWATYTWFWIAFGKEIVQLKEGSLDVKRDVLGFGRNRRFPLSAVKNLRASGIFPSSSNWENMLIQMRLRGGTVAFDDGEKTIRFGIQLSEPESREVVDALRPWLPASKV